MSCIYKNKATMRHCSKEGKEGQFCPGSGAYLQCYTPSDSLHDIDFTKIQIVTVDTYEEEIDKLRELMKRNPGKVGIIPIDTLPDVKLKEQKEYCKYCFNARIYQPTEEEMMDPFNTELTDDNDGSSCGVGHCLNEKRFMINSGMGKPVNIEFDEWNNSTSEWITVGRYVPKYCPECGRRLDEYNRQ